MVETQLFTDAPEPKPVHVKTEADKLNDYHRALSMLPLEVQNEKMNAIHSPKNLRRFLSAQAPENLVARFSHRLPEVQKSQLPEQLTREERMRIAKIEFDIQASLEKYLDLIDQPTASDSAFTTLLIEIYQGRTKLLIALGLIHEISGNEADTKTTYRNAINAGHTEGYSMLMNYYIQTEDFTSAYKLAKEALEKKFTMPAMNLAFYYFTADNDKFCKSILTMVDPNDRRSPHVQLLDYAIRTYNFDQISKIMEILRSTDDTDFMEAASLLYEGDVDRALQAFIRGLDYQDCTSILEEAQKLLKNDNNLAARIYMADHLRFLLTELGLENLGNHLVNQCKN